MPKVLIHNDDVTPMEFVVTLLGRVFGQERDDAVKTMLTAHRNGSAVCGSYSESEAQRLLTEALELARRNGHPLRLSIEETEPPAAS